MTAPRRARRPHRRRPTGAHERHDQHRRTAQGRRHRARRRALADPRLPPHQDGPRLGPGPDHPSAHQARSDPGALGPGTDDQFHLTADQLGEASQYLKDGMTLDRTSYQGETIGVELPVTVDLVVADTEPGFAGDTQTGARKPATTETGLVVQVPIFVETGDTIRIDTRTGEYQTRV